jgi:hypothetical protein
MKRLALSDVTNSNSDSESFPSFSEMIVSWYGKQKTEVRQEAGMSVKRGQL